MWNYSEDGRLLTLRALGSPDCIYCSEPLRRAQPAAFTKDARTLLAQIAVCAVCGWWKVYRVHQGELPRSPEAESYSATVGVLKELDIHDSSVALKDLRRYIAINKDMIYELHPMKVEELVADLYRDHGYSVRVTGQRAPGTRGDDGIDVILDSGAGETIGVQVKRHKKGKRVEAEAIRSLAGALVLGGHTRGIFVTTSNFRAGARSTAKRFAGSACFSEPIELVDSEGFFEALGIAQRKDWRLTREEIVDRILSPGVHVGSGLFTELDQREDLTQRPVVATIFTRDEVIEMEKG